MKPHDANSTLVSLLMGVQFIQTALGRFPPFFQTAPRIVPVQSPLPDRLFELPTSPRYTKFLPKKKNLKTRKLIKRLGHAFNPEWMSIDQPVHIHEVVSDEVDIKLVSEARHVNFSMSGSDGKRQNISGSMLAAFQEWLVQRGSCPVHFVWEDLGINFWPRWVKRGFCVDEQSCSWPPGMHCLPAENRRIRLLRWQCQPRGAKFKGGRYVGKKGDDDVDSNATENWPKITHKQRRKRYGMKCKWIKIPYPITDECFCSC
ncbi:noggin-2 [Patella vulgata]|uniref:noggin-2 n=1 Tax=Patella vulgata TaxID=6465 RepID=UPI00217F403C|nr:noggin-2 [Patella vulgata]